MVIARNLKELLLLWTTNAPFSIPLSKPWHPSPCFARMLLSAYIVVVVEAMMTHTRERPLVVPRRVKLVMVLDIPPARDLLVINEDAPVLLLLAPETSPVLLEDDEQNAEHDHAAHRRGDGDGRRHRVGAVGCLLDAPVAVLVLLEAGCRGRRGVCRVARRGRAAQC